MRPRNDRIGKALRTGGGYTMARQTIQTSVR